MKKFFRLFVFIVLLLGVIGGAVYFFKSDKEDKSQAANETIVRATRGDIEQVVTAQGKLEPKEYVDVGAQVSGQLKKLYVEIGDQVQQGDPIAEIDDKIYQSRVQGDEASLKTLRAQLAEQQANVALAQQQYSRNQRLINAKAVSQDVLQTSQTALKVAQARVTSLQAQIEQGESTLEADKTNLGFTKIYAPISGTVVSQTSREGQTLNANQTAPVIVQIANLDTMTVRAQVAEADVLRLKTGMEVYFTILGNMKRKWQAQTRQILPSPEIINEVVLYNVLVDVDNSDHELMSGMTTQMFFVLGRSEKTLLVPASALIKPVPDRNTDKGDAYLVHVRQGKQTIEKVVHVGLVSRTQAEIVDGLTEQDQLVVSGKQANSIAGGRFMGGPRL